MGGWGVLIPWKCVRGSECILTPKMSHSFIQNCRWITPQVSHHQGWKTCQTFFEAPERVWWLNLTDPDPHILRQIYATDYTYCIATARIRVWYRNISQDGTDRQTDGRTERRTSVMWSGPHAATYWTSLVTCHNANNITAYTDVRQPSCRKPIAPQSSWKTARAGETRTRQPGGLID